ncbi:MAG: 1-deoxy-D-xylulose-5-phosphate synthase [Candidatus Dormibacteraceae bacterium]
MLESIHSPKDLRPLDFTQLEELAGEIRQFLIEKVAQSGGHLSPNLGVVELTLALHRVFESPRDTLIWDVGHQAYVHKLLTGRAGAFDTLRQPGGLSGYPSRSESLHDIVENSHASTSLSYALGLAEAKLRRGEKGQVVAVIGDGALTGGMAYEALNQIAHLQPPNLIIVLNDNGRSYAPTVGGLAQHLSQLRLDPRYERLKGEVDYRLKELPGVGAQAHEAVRRVKESVKQLVQPTSIFTSLGLTYVGPVDGHDTATLEELFRLAGQRHLPSVIHVVTEKGRGYPPAIEDQVDKLHQVSAHFDPLSRPALPALPALPAWSEVFGQALLSAATRHPEVVAITAAMTSSTGLLDFAAEFPERCFDVGICEQHAVTFAAGLALGGHRPVVCIYSTFLQRAFDQLMMDVALHRLPVVFVVDRAGVTGPDGPSHHGIFDLSYLRLIPGLKVCAPADATELSGLLETALGQDGPVAIRFPRGATPTAPELPIQSLPVGEWEELRKGRDVVILAIGKMVSTALKTAELLASEGLSCGVINARWLNPLDSRLKSWAAQYPLLLTAEDNTERGGFGGAVLEALAPHGLAGKVRIAALPHRFLPHATAPEILAENRLDAEGLAAQVREALTGNPERQVAHSVDAQSYRARQA